MSSKADVRKLIRALPQLSAHDRTESSRRICDLIRGDAAWDAARVIAFFAPQPSEPDIELLWSEVGPRAICYPRVHGEGLRFFRVAGADSLTAGRFGLREPVPPSPAIPVDAADMDLVLVPGLAFTHDGVRLGRGGGYYDRFLADGALRARKLGVCFARQLVQSLPAEKHDQRVDRVIAA
jgi:5-formyltetrahydrofolate cyclo-ligase